MISALRKVVPCDVVNSLWNAAKSGRYPQKRACPACSHKMAEVPVGGDAVAIDICPACAFVWFDAGEFQQMPKTPTPQEAAKKPMNPELARLTAMHKVEHIREQARREKSSPDEAWKYIPALLGAPVEFDCETTRCAPVVTWSLLAVVTATSLLGFAGLLSPLTFGLIPAEWSRLGGLTFLSYFFLHGGILHLLGNLYFLYVFGDNVEDFLGRKKYLMLLADATLAGGVAYVLWHHGSMTPCIGASAGISGILAYYALRFPKHRIGVLFFFCKWIRFPVMGYFAFWVLIQIIGAYGRTGHVAYMAHIGGLLAGVLFWLIERSVRSAQ
jgi:membrane associated rhomboid family serine protease